ncbi:unnamed protein product [Spirodela intermedia]|uniref:Uncharacterized protein n=1 Tax=Spirodela intermedia TaxID=51605 RepID=A0ABN7E7U0_SPIIN|nr:unnamed protein product [Spirodela intermedia]
MSLLFPLHPGPSNTVRVLANAGVTDATSRKTMRRAAPTVCCGLREMLSTSTHVSVAPRSYNAIRRVIDGGTLTPLSFHITGGQPIVGLSNNLFY